MAQEVSEILTRSSPAFVPGKMTYEEFLRNYYGKYVEFVRSEVIGPMTVSLRHDQLTAFLRNLMQLYVESKDLSRVCGEPFQMKMEFEDGIHGREPDIFFVKDENLSRLGDRFYDGGADLVVEIISPDSVIRDTREKFEEYEAAGVTEYWIIDHYRRTANFYGFDTNGKYELLPLSPDGKFSSRVINGLWIKTDWLWEKPLPKIMEIIKVWGLR